MTSARRLALLALLCSGCTCNSLAGAPAQLTQTARDLQATRALSLGEGLPTLALTRARIDRILPEATRAPPRVIFTLDAEGTLRTDAGSIAVSSLGLEIVPMAAKRSGFAPLERPFPQLAGVVRALELRRRAETEGSILPVRWLIRLERGKAQVTEERADGSRRSAIAVQQTDGTYLLHP